LSWLRLRTGPRPVLVYCVTIRCQKWHMQNPPPHPLIAFWKPSFWLRNSSVRKGVAPTANETVTTVSCVLCTHARQVRQLFLLFLRQRTYCVLCMLHAARAVWCGAAQCCIVSCLPVSLEGEHRGTNFRGIRCQAGRLPWCVAVWGGRGVALIGGGDRRLETCRACLGGRQALTTKYTKDLNKRQIAECENPQRLFVVLGCTALRVIR
jgi:hypothetical protein